MSLEDLIAAERATPPRPTEREAKSLWKRIRSGAATAAVPPAFDISPASTVVTAKAKISAALSTALGKVVVGTAVAGTLVGGAAAGLPDEPGDNPAVAHAAADAADETRVDDGARRKAKRASQSTATALPEPDAPPETAEPVRPELAAEPQAAVAEPAASPETAPIPAQELTAPTVATPAPTRPATQHRREKQPNRFSDEVALIRRAQTSLAAGRHAAALSALAEHRRTFPRGAMKEDRAALRALALCGAGRTAQGQREAQQFAKRYPRSLYADRVREACS